MADPAYSETSLAEVLRNRAESTPDDTAFIFLEEDGSEQPATYGELHSEARKVAAVIDAQNSSPGGPVLLLFAPGLDYVAALFGCFYAGAPAVPAFPPDPFRISRTLPRLLAILEDSAADLVLTTEPLRESLEEWLRSGGSSSRVVATDVPHGGAENPAAGDPPSDALAMLQYTSGSTRSPSGVMLAHEQLLSNAARMQVAFEFSERDVATIWLPPYHDMGLIGGIIQSVYSGMRCVLMSPLTFLKRPITWLSALSRHRATVSGAPNFAYDLCVRRTKPEEREGLDLSNLELTFSGSEPVSAATLTEFSRTFAPYGFRHEAFLPAYGLAEATLMVSGTARLAGPRLFTADRDQLERGCVVESASGGDDARVLVSCGAPPIDHTVAIVDPSSLQKCPEGRVGEIWFSGPNVARGYWRKPEETRETFHATTSDTGEGPFLRTGDLGFLLDGQVFVSGRLKDVIVVNGRNYHPVDIEKGCEAAVPGVRRGCGAVFAMESPDGREGIGVVYEVGAGNGDHAETLDAVRRAISMETSMKPEAVALVAPRTIPKTSSGKIQRYLCRERLLADELDTV
ncbi:MAG TPA: fatty acyl-AMP ligase, partial [Thermoleophilaceae bacterium]